MWREPRQIRGVVQSGRTKGPSTYKPHRETKCLDCGHVWWSTSRHTVDLDKFNSR